MTVNVEAELLKSRDDAQQIAQVLLRLDQIGQQIDELSQKSEKVKM